MDVCVPRCVPGCGCANARLHVCTGVSLCAWMWVCARGYMFTDVCVHMHVCVCAHMGLGTCACLCTHMDLDVCTHMEAGTGLGGHMVWGRLGVLSADPVVL